MLSEGKINNDKTIAPKTNQKNASFRISPPGMLNGVNSIKKNKPIIPILIDNIIIILNFS